MDNYIIARDRAQAIFLEFNQEEMIQRWHLRHTEQFLYVNFLQREYAVCRNTGIVIRTADGKQAGFSEVLSIFDLLCHKEENQSVSGCFAPVNSLRGRTVAIGVGTSFYDKKAKYFDMNKEAFRTACCTLGGIPVAMGDIGFQFQLFDRLQIILKFYEADEDFPASIVFLWDENTLSFMFYETVFYVAGFLLEEILELMKNDDS